MTWEIKERQRYAIIEQDTENPLRHRGMFSIGPCHVKHHSTKEFIESTYVENPGFASESNCRVFAQNSHIAIEVYDFYNKLFDPDYETVSVYDERFDVQYLFKEPDTWRSVDYYNPRIEVIPLADGVDIKKTFDTDYGSETLEITYTVKTGARLKHTIVFTSRMAQQRTFRVVMKLSGITSDKVKHGQFEEQIIEEKHIVTPVMLFGEDNQHLKLSEYLWSLGETDEITGEWTPTTLKDIVLDVHGQGCKADIIIGNYVLAENESLLIDPDSDTWQIGADTDDAEEWNTGQMDLNSSAIHLGDFAGRQYSTGFRFQNVGIPTDVDITLAKLEFRPTTNDTGVVFYKWYGNKVDSATTFIVTAFDIRDRDRTTAFVDENPPVNWTTGVWVYSADISTIIEELVGTGNGWSSGNDLAILEIWQSGFGERLAISHVQTPSNSAKLEVIWEEAGGETYNVTAEDGLELADTNLTQAVLNSVSSDDFLLSDLPSSLGVLNSISADGFTLADTPSRILVVYRTSSDGMVLADATSVQTVLNSLASDDLELGDLPSSRASFISVVSEGLELSDASLLVHMFDKLASDGFVMSDSPLAQAVLNSLSTDGLELCDTPYSRAVLNALSEDGLTLSDAITLLNEINKTATDGLVLGDAVTSQAILNALSEDGFILSDFSALLGTIYNLLAEDGFNLADLPLSIASLFSTIQEGLVLGDTSYRTLWIPKTASDGLILSDLNRINKLYLMTVTDGLVFADLVGGTVWFCKLIRVSPSRLEIVRLPLSRLPLCRRIRRS